MTGYSQDAIVHQGRLDPGIELIEKPFRRDALAVRVRAVLDSELSGPNIVRLAGASALSANKIILGLKCPLRYAR
jgi:hypothetical protein